MKALLCGAAVLALSMGFADAQSMNKTDSGNAKGAGTVGAMQNAPANGIATDPQQVQAQQGNASKAAAGTVGAAPGADAPSQKPTHAMKQ